MLQFGPRLTFVPVLALASSKRFKREIASLGTHAGFLTVVEEQTRTGPRRTKSISSKRFKLEIVTRCPKGHGDECPAGTKARP
jgi:hypothetical protein